MIISFLIFLGVILFITILVLTVKINKRHKAIKNAIAWLLSGNQLFYIIPDYGVATIDLSVSPYNDAFFITKNELILATPEELERFLYAYLDDFTETEVEE